MKRASKAVGLVLITSAAFLLGCKGSDDTAVAEGSDFDDDGISTSHHYDSSQARHFYSSSSGFHSSSGHSFSSGSHFSSGSSHGGFGSSGHAASS